MRRTISTDFALTALAGKLKLASALGADFDQPGLNGGTAGRLILENVRRFAGATEMFVVDALVAEHSAFLNTPTTVPASCRAD